ncbi:hypothetical protein [Streptomyces lydicus]|uniref:hypothetical protein n=1 Tax=Streptomyces lydicus TaxID=47763 RepID=UPI0037A1FCBC
MTYALPLVAFADPDGLETEVDLYRAAQAALQADGQPTVPLGAFGQILRALGYRKTRVGPRRFVTGLVLLDPPDAP